MKFEFDEDKRALTLEHRGLDFAKAEEIFAGTTITIEDDRQDYGEVRYQTIGRLDGVMVMVVWTPRSEARRIISMRRCNDRERGKYEEQLDRSG